MINRSRLESAFGVQLSHVNNGPSDMPSPRAVANHRANVNINGHGGGATHGNGNGNGNGNGIRWESSVPTSPRAVPISTTTSSQRAVQFGDPSLPPSPTPRSSAKKESLQRKKTQSGRDRPDSVARRAQLSTASNNGWSYLILYFKMVFLCHCDCCVLWFNSVWRQCAIITISSEGI
jgi:hypothetical protein